MSEVLRELVVALSLDSDNFARNLRTINKQIKEAESTFNLAGAGIDKFESSITGTEAKLSMLGQKLTNQKLAVEQYSRALVQANQKLVDSHARQVKMTQALEEARQKYAVLPAQIELARARYEAWNTAVGEGDARTQQAKAELDALEQEYKDVGAEIKKLEGQLIANAKTIRDMISRANELLNSFLGLDQGQRQSTIQFAAMAAAAGPAILVLGKTIGAVGKVSGALGKGIAIGITGDKEIRAIQNAARFLETSVERSTGNRVSNDNRKTYHQNQSVTVNVDSLAVHDQQGVRALEIDALKRRILRGKGG